MLALCSRRSVTLKRVNGDATSAVCRLRKYVSEALHAIPNCLWMHGILVRNAMKQKLLLNQMHVVEVCEGGDTSCSFAYRFTLQCDTICRAFGLCSSIPIVIWCDYCLLVSLRFRFHIELAKCLLFRFRSSDLIPKCERDKNSQNTTQEKWCTPRKSSISSCSCLGSLEEPLFFRMVFHHDCYV